MNQNMPSDRGAVDCTTPGETVTGEVVTYDPVRRQGYIKLDRTDLGRVFFRLNDLHTTVKEVIVDESRKLNKAKKEKLPAQEFKQLLYDIRTHLIGQRFRFEIKKSQSGKLNIKKSTIEVVST